MMMKQTALAALLPLLAGLSIAAAQQPEIQTRGVIAISSGPPGEGGEMVIDSSGFDDGGGMMFFGGGPGGIGEMVGGALGGMLGGGGSMAFPITPQEAEQYGKLLRFSSDQIDAAKTLLDGYLAAFKTKADEVKAKSTAIREEAKENDDNGAFKKLAPLMKDLQEERTKGETAYLADFKSVATPDQMARWEKVEMYRRRGKGLRGGGGMINFMGGGPAGERVDLIRILSQLSLPAGTQGKLDPILDAWELDIDARLKERTALQTRQRDAMKEGAKNQDFSGFMKFQDEQYEQALKMRDINRAFARQVTDALPPDSAGKFDLEFRKQSFPNVYRQRYSAKAILAAEKFDDLSAAQQKDLAMIKASYEKDGEVINRRAEQAADQQEADSHKQQAADAQGNGEGGMTFSISRMMGGNDDPASEAIKKDRKDLEDKTVAALTALLNDDQKARLPVRPGVDSDAQPKMRMMQKNNFQGK